MLSISSGFTFRLVPLLRAGGLVGRFIGRFGVSGFLETRKRDFEVRVMGEMSLVLVAIDFKLILFDEKLSSKSVLVKDH